MRRWSGRAGAFYSRRRAILKSRTRAGGGRSGGLERANKWLLISWQHLHFVVVVVIVGVDVIPASENEIGGNKQLPPPGSSPSGEPLGEAKSSAAEGKRNRATCCIVVTELVATVAVEEAPERAASLATFAKNSNRRGGGRRSRSLSHLEPGHRQQVAAGEPSERPATIRPMRAGAVHTCCLPSRPEPASSTGPRAGNKWPLGGKQ